MMKKKFLYTPVKLVAVYLVLTLILFKWGAYSWNIEEPLFFWGLNLLYILCIILGYLWGVVIKTGKEKKVTFDPSDKSTRCFLNRVFLILAVLSVVCTYLETVRSLGLSTMSPAAILAQAKTALEHPAEWYAYTYSDDFFGNYGGKIFSVLVLIIQPMLYAVIPLTIFWSDILKPYNKILGGTVIGMQMAKWIVSGKNKGIFDIAIYIGIVLIIKIFRDRLKNGKMSLRNKLVFLLMIIGGIFVIAKFGSTINARLGGNWEAYTVAGYSVDLDSPLLKMLPEAFKGLLVYLTLYLTQGYQALSLITNMPWIPLWGIGYSKFIVEYIGRYFNIDIASLTYQYRLQEYGWDPDLNWHSLYLYIANDTGLIGCAIVLFFLGVLLGITYYEALYQRSALSLLLLIQLCVICLYIPANNIIFNHIGSFVTFYVIFFLWLFRKIHLNRKIKGFR